MTATTRSRSAATSVAVLAAGILAWWAITAVGSVPSYLLPTPGAVAATLVEHPALYARSAWFTLQRALLGGAIGSLIGFGLGVVVDVVPWFRRALYPYLVTARVLPKLAIAPLLLIYLGAGPVTGLLFVVVMTVFPVVVTTAAGLRGTPQRQRDLAASVRADPVTTFVRVRLPYALPDVFGGLKQSAVLAVVGAVVAEWVVTTRGLGALLLLALENVQPAVMVAAIAVLFVEGLGIYGLVVAVERCAAWRPGDPV